LERNAREAKLSVGTEREEGVETAGKVVTQGVHDGILRVNQ
jgi:hypothetical protein